MKILVVNCGSSSLKFQLIDSETEEVAASGLCERIGLDGALIYKVNGDKIKQEIDLPDHEVAIKKVLDTLLDKEIGVLTSLDEIGAIGHRMVHGGEKFSSSVIINEEIIKQIETCNDLAPLHNPANLLGVRACQEVMPGVPNVVVFDTAFHQTMPKTSYIYPIPYEYYEKYKVRKYGAHGTSHDYVSARVAEIMNKKRQDLKIVTCHLGQGASICAIKNGKSIDTSMGLTPLGGIAMVTRSGDLDPSVVTYIMEKTGLEPNKMNSILNKKSGLAAICNMAPDFREIEEKSYNNKDAKVAIDIFTSTIAQYIARYAVKLNGIDVIVFTGGIGENQINVRKSVCEQLSFMGLEVDDEKNNSKGEETEISTPASKIKVYIIPTDEEMMIANETIRLVKQ